MRLNPLPFITSSVLSLRVPFSLSSRLLPPLPTSPPPALLCLPPPPPSPTSLFSHPGVQPPPTPPPLQIAELTEKVQAAEGFGAWQPDGWVAAIKGDRRNRRYGFTPPSGKPQLRSLSAAEKHILKHAPDAKL